MVKDQRKPNKQTKETHAQTKIRNKTEKNTKQENNWTNESQGWVAGGGGD